MNFLKQLKNASIFGGLLFVISLLNTLSIDFWGVAAAVAGFLILAIHDVGKKYIELTNQSEVVKKAFGTVVDPWAAIICVASFIYVCVGVMVWYFWFIAFFFGFILFVVDATALIDAVKKSKT